MHENLMKDIQRAERCGLSYGNFKAIQRETGEAWKEYKAGNPKHFDRVTKSFGRVLRTAEGKRWTSFKAHLQKLKSRENIENQRFTTFSPALQLLKMVLTRSSRYLLLFYFYFYFQKGDFIYVTIRFTPGH